MLNTISRQLLDFWGWIGIAPGWQFAAIEKFGHRLSCSYRLLSVLPNQCRLECDLKEFIERQIYFLGTYEPIEAYLFSRLLQPGMTVIDIGANVGQYTLLAATAVGETGAVHSFEPVPKIFAQISNNVRNNNLSNVHLNALGVWKEATFLNLGILNGMEDHCELYSVGFGNQANQVTTTAIALDSYVQSCNLRQVDLIKMDVEGAEYCALLGMVQTLKRDHPLLQMEINRPALERLGYTPEDIWKLVIEELGYEAYLIESQSCQKVTHFSKLKQSPNYLFVHPSRPTSVVNETSEFKAILRWSRSCKHIF